MNWANTYNDMCLQAIGVLDVKFDPLIQSFDHYDGYVTLGVVYDPELIDVLISMDSFDSRQIINHGEYSEFKFKIDQCWEQILDLLRISNQVSEDTLKYQWDKSLFFIGDRNPAALNYAKMIAATFN